MVHILHGAYSDVFVRLQAGIMAMSSLTRRLSVVELRDRMLAMAKTGVYRQSLFDTFQPVATQRQICSAIRQAKGLGLTSVAALRDPDLGTYYQLDTVRYARWQAAGSPTLMALSPADQGDDGVDDALSAHQVINTMLGLAGSATVLLGITAGLGWMSGQTKIGTGAALGAVLIGALWRLQHWVAYRRVP